MSATVLVSSRLWHDPERRVSRAPCAQAALDAECARVASTTTGRNEQLSRSDHREARRMIRAAHLIRFGRIGLDRAALLLVADTGPPQSLKRQRAIAARMGLNLGAADRRFGALEGPIQTARRIVAEDLFPGPDPPVWLKPKERVKRRSPRNLAPCDASVDHDLPASPGEEIAR
jgi:hypothetical protein